MSKKEVRTYTKEGDKILISHEPQEGKVGGICREPLPPDFFDSPADLYEEIDVLKEARERLGKFYESLLKKD